MADTAVNSANRVTQWADDEFYAYVRMNPFKPLMGTSPNSVIQVKEELTKDAGDSITFSLVTRLVGAGVTGDSTLQGNEEALGNYGQKVFVDQIRHGVVVGRFEKIKTKIDLLDAAKTMLRIWNMEKLRDLFIARWLSPHVDGVTTYAAATVTERNTWATSNNPNVGNQRILYGTSKANFTGVHATDLATIDGTADDMHQNIVRLIKRLAQSADPTIRPVVVNTPGRAGSEQYILLMGSLPFRDLSANFETVLQNAAERGDGNPIFSADDLKIGNVICKEVPEMDRLVANGGCNLGGVGTAGAPVEAAFLVGAQSLLLPWAQRMQVKTDEFDYENRRGVAVSEIRGCAKASFNGFQHGTATVFVSAVGD